MNQEPTILLQPGTNGNGLADMLANLLRQNLLDRPEKMRDFTRLVGRVGLVAEDANIALTMCFSEGKVSIFDGIYGIPNLLVRGTSQDLLNLSRLSLRSRLRLPDPRDEVYGELVAALRSGRLRVRGALGNLPLVVGLTRVLSVH